MRKQAVAVLTLALCSTSPFTRAKEATPARRCAPELQTHLDTAPVIQLAILLDTSNSMDGLIDQARSQLWKIVNELARARRGSRPARLEVALYEYGNSRLAPASAWVRRVLPFTSDLDRVSEELFALKTSGGDEYCGTVIQTALDELAWSSAPADLKVIFIAGNEPFTQGPVDFRPVCRRALEKGIAVNTIHCGSRDEGARTGWEEGALMASGSFASIDQNRKAEHVAAPQDDEIARLGLELNQTYVPYGNKGREGQLRQTAQDQNASGAGAASSTSRAVTKANKYYSNSTWDLVDATRDAQVDASKLKAEELPAEMQKLGPEARKAYVLGKAKERERLQASINALNAARAKYVAAARAAAGQGTKDETLDVAMARTLRDQAACHGIELQ